MPGEDAVDNRIWRILEWWNNHPLTSCRSIIDKRWNMPYEIPKICDMTKKNHAVPMRSGWVLETRCERNIFGKIGCTTSTFLIKMHHIYAAA